MAAKSKKLTAENVLQLGKAVYAFPVLNRRKPKDDSGAIYEMPDGKRYIILLNQGEAYIARPGELLQKIAEYEEAEAMSEFALRIFYNEDPKTDLH